MCCLVTICRIMTSQAVVIAFSVILKFSCQFLIGQLGSETRLIEFTLIKRTSLVHVLRNVNVNELGLL